MNRRLPPFAAIRAFEAAARLSSFKAAADELCVTPSAVSHQIRKLEEYLSTRLFDRTGNHLALTMTGQAYVGKLTGLLDGLYESTRAASINHATSLTVLSTPGFAARWLVPRLNRFEHSDVVRLRVSEGAPSTDFANNGADLVIHWSDASVPDVLVEPFMSSYSYPVASPDYVRQNKIDRPEDLLRVTLLYEEVMDGWADWFAAAGLGSPRLPAGPRFPHCELSTTAAEGSQGVALAYDAMIRSTLEKGSLVRLFDAVTTPITMYSLATPISRQQEPLIVAFRNWIFSEVSWLNADAPSVLVAAQ